MIDTDVAQETQHEDQCDIDGPQSYEKQQGDKAGYHEVQLVGRYPPVSPAGCRTARLTGRSSASPPNAPNPAG